MLLAAVRSKMLGKVGVAISTSPGRSMLIH